MSGFVSVRESLRERWLRRAVTVPAYLVAGSAAIALLPFTIPLGFLIDAARGNRRLAGLRCILGISHYVACEAFGISGAFVLWLANLVLPGRDADREARWNLWLQRVWARTLFWGATRLFGIRTESAGLESARQGPLFLFARHTSILDSLLPVVFCAHPEHLRLAHVMKRELLWDPCLDIVGQRTRNAFIRRGSGDWEREIELLRQLAATSGDVDGVLLFPEGTRFSAERYRKAVATIEANGQTERLARARQLRNVLPPHYGGAFALLSQRPDIDVAFLAHEGFEGTTSLRDLWNGELIGKTIRLSCWRIASSEIPRADEARGVWLDQQWKRIDDWIVEAKQPS